MSGRHHHHHFFCFLAGAIVMLAGCGNNSSASTDSGPPDAGVPLPPPASVLDGADMVPADLSCRDMRTRPAGGATVTFTAHIYDFQSGPDSTVAEPVDVDIFPDNVVTPDCTGMCMRANAGMTGDIMAMGPEGGWFAYRVHMGSGERPTSPVLTVGYNRVVPTAGGRIALPSVSSMTIGFIPSLYSRRRVPGTAIVSGSLSDCEGRAIANAVLRLYRGDTLLQPGPNPDDYFIGYFNGASLPDRRRQYTNTDGIYAAANVDPGTEPLRIELWAVLGDSDTLERIACEEVQVFADAVTIVSVGPERGDYPPGSRCN
jgi:hypothetical protein